jgi:hypothetical protein
MKRLDNIHISSHPIEMIIETKTLQIYDVLYTYKTCPIQTPTNFRMSGQLQPCYVKTKIKFLTSAAGAGNAGQACQ